ncbi:glycerophosphoryl diester phosphodiesterase [Sporosarcina luteola]|nr:glycerophosphoryl diester phosphodiesterase [Sporosarcina luteola]
MRRLVAHRGWSGRAPENTMAAIMMALGNDTVEAIELDVHLSKDGVPVVIHDFTLERTTDGSGLVGDHTVEELQQLDAGYWFNGRFAYERIPTLEDVLLLAKGRKRLLVELKQKAGYYAGLEENVVELIQRHGMTEEVLVISFDHMSLQQVKALDPSIAVGPLFLGLPTLIAEQVRQVRASYIGMHHEFLTKEIVEAVQPLGIELGVWTVDTAEDQERLKNLSDSLVITTNHPERLVTQQEKVGV